MSNLISAEIPAAKLTEIMAAITVIRTGMPFLLMLDKPQKRVLSSLDDTRIPFVNKCLQYAQRDPKIAPAFVDLAEMNKDIVLFNNLQSISRDLLRLADMVNDTRIAAGSDAYSAALSIYNSAKQAAKMNVPGSQAIVDDLKKLFEVKSDSSESASAAKKA